MIQIDFGFSSGFLIFQIPDKIVKTFSSELIDNLFENYMKHSNIQMVYYFPPI